MKHYFVSYYYSTDYRNGFGMCEIALPREPWTFDDIIELIESISSTSNIPSNTISILNYQLLSEE